MSMWALWGDELAPVLRRMAYARPSFFYRAADASPAIRHCYALYLYRHLRAGEAPPDADIAAWADALETLRVNDILSSAIGCRPPNTMGLLRRIPEYVQPREFYATLVACLIEPRSNLILVKARHPISRGFLDAVQSALTLHPLVDNALVLDRHSKMEIARLDHLLRLAERLGVPLDPRQFRHCTSSRQMQQSLLWAVMDRMAVPLPPWEGTERLHPIRSPRELRATARRFENCLAQPDHLLSLLHGTRAYYVWQGEPDAVVALKRGLLGEWTLDEIGGPKNLPLGQANEEEIKREVMRFPHVQEVAFDDTLEILERGYEVL